jgi:hypothetical protein
MQWLAATERCHHLPQDMTEAQRNDWTQAGYRMIAEVPS